MSKEESLIFLRIVARILATENVLLPPAPLKPWEWPRDDRMLFYERKRLFWGEHIEGNMVPYNLRPSRKLGRYVTAIGERLRERGSIHNTRAWLGRLRQVLWDALRGLNILESAGIGFNNKVPYGIRIERFELHPFGDNVSRCSACRYVMGETLLDVCYRCGQDAQETNADTIENYYRRAALFASPESAFPDPYAMRATNTRQPLEERMPATSSAGSRRCSCRRKIRSTRELTFSP